MRLIVVTLLSILLLTACRKRQFELKYDEHKSYAEFLAFLETKIDTIDNDFAKISFVRQKVAELIDVGIGEKDLSIIGTNWHSMSGEQFYTILLNDLATFKCGPSAVFLKTVYKNLGFSSITYDMGCEGTSFTHQVTLVKSHDTKDYYIQDAYLNVTFINKQTREGLMFKELVNLLSLRQDSNAIVLRSKYDFEPTWDTTGLDKLMASNDFYTTLKKEDVTDRYQITEILTRYRGVYNLCLKDNELPDKNIYLYLLPQQHNSNEIIKIVRDAVRVK